MLSAEVILRKIPLPPRLKGLIPPALRWINRQTQVDLKIFLPAFGGTIAALAILIALLPSYRPVIKETAPTEIPKWASAPVAVNKEGGGEMPKGALNRPLTEREKQAADNNDAMTHNALLVAPVEALEEGPARQRIPKIADDGRRPWFVYSRPFDRVDPRPRIAVVVADLGLNRLLTENAIENLPAQATMIFESDNNAEAWMARARAQGHEVLLSVPMEPFDYPANDPGPGTLLSNSTPEDNVARLHDALALGKGYVGITTLSGSRFTTASAQLKPILKETLDRGLLWFDARLVPLSSAYDLGQEMKLPSVSTDFRITGDKSREAADQILQDAETSARHAGASVVLVYATPASLQMINDWAKTLPDKGFALAPVTAIVD